MSDSGARHGEMECAPSQSLFAGTTKGLCKGVAIMEAWHFLRSTRRTRDWVMVTPGLKLHVDPPLEMCVRGLHASVRALDALGYAPGPIICRVRLAGEIIRDTDKVVATDREVLWMADATKVLHEFALWCAERALTRERDAGRKPDPRSWAALKAKQAWLRGETTDAELAAAQAAATAAWEATWKAAWEPIWDAIKAAAWAAASAAAWDAVETAAYAAKAAATAAWATANVAARKATKITRATHVAWELERAAQDEKLTQMLEALKESGGDQDEGD